jgi:phosphoenolpyruvate-protein kinase (PTS system EI component)
MRRIKREVSICGMMGARVEFLPLFLELGVTNFSVPLGAYETVRQRLMSIDPQQRMLRALLRMQSRAEIREALQS